MGSERCVEQRGLTPLAIPYRRSAAGKSTNRTLRVPSARSPWRLPNPAASVAGRTARGACLLLSFQNNHRSALRNKILAGRTLNVLRRYLLRRLVQAIDRVQRTGRRDERYHRLGRVRGRIELHQEAVLLVPLHLGKLLGIDGFRLEPLNGAFQRLLHRRQVFSPLDDGCELEERRIAVHRHAGEDRLGLLLVQDELLIDVAG